MVVAPAVRSFGIWKDDGDGQFDGGIDDTKLACVTNMLQYLSAGTSYGYKQWNNTPGADLSAWGNSSEGALSGTTHKTWIKPEPNTLQFWLGWSRLDHDTANPEFADAARGFNLNIVMHQVKKH